MRHAGRSLLATQPRPSCQGSIQGSANKPANASTTVQTSTTINATRGDIFVAKMSSGLPTLYGSGIASTGGTATVNWSGTPAVDIRTSGACPMSFFIGVCTASGTIQPTANFVSTNSGSTSSTYIVIVVERWQNARVETNPATGVALIQTSTPSSGPWTSTFTPTNFAGQFTYAVADYVAVNGPPAAYAGNSSVETQNFFVNPSIGLYCAYQPNLSVGVAQTFGVTAPSGQRATAQGIEIKPIGS